MKADRKFIYDKFGGKCAYCGCDLKGKFQADHVIPQRNFRQHVMNNWRVPEFLSHLEPQDCNHKDNMFPACGSCNKYKDTHCLETFRDELGKMRERLNLHSTHYKISRRFGLIEEIQKPIIFILKHYDRQRNTARSNKPIRCRSANRQSHRRNV